MLAACTWLKPANSCMPEAPGISLTPWRVVIMISGKVFWPAKKWPKLYSARAPRAICALAKPRSASNNMTLKPIWRKATARLMEAVVLPTPPLPLAMPMISVLRGLLMGQACGFGLKASGNLCQFGAGQVVQGGVTRRVGMIWGLGQGQIV